MFVNFTNHPSQYWEKEQWDASARYGEIVDVPFPRVDPYESAAGIRREAEKCAALIQSKNPGFVLCQGEFCLAYHVIKLLRAAGIAVGAACSERRVQEKHSENGTEKTAFYHFVQYREYE